MLQVCKITDPARDPRKNDNHTIAFLLEHSDFSSDPLTLKRLSDLHDKLLAFRKKLLPARNKLISHSDRDSILAGLQLGAASDEEWNQFWLDLQDVICIMRKKAMGGPPFYLNAVAMLSDADALLKALRHSSYFGQLLDDPDPAVRAKCAKLALG